jgi:anti-sigma factor RsiW
VNDDFTQLCRYLDGDLSPEEAQRFQQRLAQSPELSRQLAEQRLLGNLVRRWSISTEERAADLLEPTLVRVREAQRARVRRTHLGYALAAMLVLALPWSRRPPELGSAPAAVAAPVSSAAIERVEAPDRQAQVFVVGRSATPVVWLADDAQDDDETHQGPG